MRALGEEPRRCQASYVRADIDFLLPLLFYYG